VTVHENLFAVFSTPPDEVGENEFNEWYDLHVREIVEVPHVVAARRFAVKTRRGDEAPAHYRYLSLYELDSDVDTAKEALERGADRRTRPAWFGGIRFSSWKCTGLGDHGPVIVPDHLCLVFTGEPPSMNFDAYSDWYEEHQADNVANTSTIVRGWRFGLSSFSGAAGPTHLAAYELDGDIDKMSADLSAALEAGKVSLPDWFRRFAGLEATALDDRVLPAS
jgi:hypothetical protein